MRDAYIGINLEKTKSVWKKFMTVVLGGQDEYNVLHN